MKKSMITYALEFADTEKQRKRDLKLIVVLCVVLGVLFVVGLLHKISVSILPLF